MSDASKKVMRLLHQCKDNVAWRLIRVLVGLALEKDTLTLHRASGDVNLKNLLLLRLIANNSLTSHHARTNLAEGLDDTVTLAALAGRRLGLLLATRALTLAAKNLLVGGKLDSLAAVELLERDLVLLLLIRATSRSARATLASGTARAARTHAEAKHLGKDIVEVDLGTARTAAGLIEGGHAVNIVELALLLIAKNFVCLCDFLELDFGLFSMLFGDLVWMDSLRYAMTYFSVGLLDLLWCRRFLDLE
ncbi:hypothetical protein HG530_000669 [Fusarium avenaceum]|nr:hypothetical protein HG530_000669 [Fusarium avenaceum]